MKKARTTRKDHRGQALERGESEFKTPTGEIRYRYQFMNKLTHRRETIYANTLADLREKKRIQLAAFKMMVTRYAAFDQLYPTKEIMPATLDDLFDLAAPHFGYQFDSLVQLKKCYDFHVRGTRLGQKYPRDIDTIDIEDLVRQLHAQGLRKGTIQKVVCAVKKPLEYAVKKHWIFGDPTLHAISVLRNIYDEQDRIALTEEQQERLFRFLENSKNLKRFAPMLRLYLELGLRPSEFYGLSYDELNEDRARPIFFIAHQIRYERLPETGKFGYALLPPKTRAGRRAIALTDEAIAALEQIRKSQELDPPPPYEITAKIGGKEKTVSALVCPRPNGMPHTPQTFTKILNRIIREYNAYEEELAKKEKRKPVLLPHFSSKAFRKTAATRGADCLTDQEQIERIGHTSINTTRHNYTVREINKAIETADKMSENNKKIAEKYKNT